jgi:hypothetical protein
MSRQRSTSLYFKTSNNNSNTVVDTNNINPNNINPLILIKAADICHYKLNIFENPKVIYWRGKYRNTEHKLLHKVLNEQQKESMNQLIYNILNNS